MSLSQQELDTCSRFIGTRVAGCRFCGGTQTPVLKDLATIKINGNAVEQLMVQTCCEHCGNIQFYMASTVGIRR